MAAKEKSKTDESKESAQAKTEAPEATKTDEGTAPADAGGAPDGGDGVTEPAEQADFDEKETDTEGAAEQPEQPAGTVYSDEEIEKLKEAAYRSGYTEGAADAVSEDDETTASHEGGEFTGQPEPGETTAPGFDWSRADLIAVALRLPVHLRRGGLRPIVDRLATFLDGVPWEVQSAASVFIRAIAEVRPDEIVSGRYEHDVRNALSVLAGIDERNAIATDPDSKRAAEERLHTLQGNPVPSGFRADQLGAPLDTDVVTDRPEVPEPDLDGSEDQNAAAKRLYARNKGSKG